MMREIRRWIALLAATCVIAGAATLGAATPAFAADAIDGSGSTWSQIAVDQWRADVARTGLIVNFQGIGSSAGRQAYIQNQADFAVSEVPFQPASFNREGQQIYDEVANAASRPYAYLPIVAGGTSVMYHLEVAGQKVTDLKLSGRTLALIFTGGIKNWNDPAIAADNGGRNLPSLPIVPVVRSDGSGTSAQFSAYLADMVPDVWNPFCTAKLNKPAPCPPTSLYPFFEGSKAQALSDGVANFVSAPYNNGSITYVEYGYALERNYPVASVLNAAGYYRQPTAENVALALTKARINSDRTAILADVYRNSDPRSYPISSYSLMIVPTTAAAGFTPGKGETLGKFIQYFLCTGQQKAKALGYSPLPPNLVQFGFDAQKLIPGAPPPPPISQCANPTITGQFNLNGVALPSAAEKAGATKAAAGSTGGSGGSGSAGAATDAGAGATTDGALAGGDAAAAANLQSQPISIAKGRDSVSSWLYAGIAALLLLVVFAPPTIAMATRKREGPTVRPPPATPDRA